MNNINFRPVRKDLYTRFGHRATTTIIDAILDEVIEQHTATARVPDFLPVLVHREAAERIEEHLWTHGSTGTPRKRILFASRTNAPRAVLAAAIARHISDNAIVATVASWPPTAPSTRPSAAAPWPPPTSSSTSTTRSRTTCRAAPTSSGTCRPPTAWRSSRSAPSPMTSRPASPACSPT